jgi:tRNA threonylcarbamoyladenosine biosynthesis protein TsaE
MTDDTLPASLKLHLPDAAATEACGAAVARTVFGGMVITLRGELGSGKTTLVRGLLHARGVAGPIKSPTYSLVEHYSLSSLYFYHFDFHRFRSSDEWDAAGMSEYFTDDAVCIVEWPERAGDRLRAADLALSLAYAASDGRELIAIAHTPAALPCLTALRESAHPRI